MARQYMRPPDAVMVRALCTYLLSLANRFFVIVRAGSSHGDSSSLTRRETAFMSRAVSMEELWARNDGRVPVLCFGLFATSHMSLFRRSDADSLLTRRTAHLSTRGASTGCT